MRYRSSEIYLHIVRVIIITIGVLVLGQCALLLLFSFPLLVFKVTELTVAAIVASAFRVKTAAFAKAFEVLC